MCYPGIGIIEQWLPILIELKKKGHKLRYSDEMNNMLALTPYALDDDIEPAEKFERLERFTAKMDELKIPNPRPGDP